MFSTIFADADKSPHNNFYRYGNNLNDEFSKYNDQLYHFLGEFEESLISNFNSLNILEEKNSFEDIDIEALCSGVISLVLQNNNFSLMNQSSEIRELNDKIINLLKGGYDTFQKNRISCENTLIVKEFNQKLEPFKDDLNTRFAEMEQSIDISNNSLSIQELLGSGLALMNKCQKIAQKIKSLQLDFLVSSDSLVILLENFKKESLLIDDILANLSSLEQIFEGFHDRVVQIETFDFENASNEQVS
jgi:hypothetical protein